MTCLRPVRERKFIDRKISDSPDAKRPLRLLMLMALRSDESSPFGS
jgi:hypothetical protein